MHNSRVTQKMVTPFQKSAATDPVTATIDRLSKSENILGVVIQVDDEIIGSSSTLPEKRIEFVCRHLHEISTAYVESKRIIDDLLFAYETCQILAIIEKNTIIWTVVRTGINQLEKIQKELRNELKILIPHLLPEDAPNESISKEDLTTEWAKHEELLESLLRKVMGSAQTKSLIQRHLKDTLVPEPGREKETALNILESIPNKTKRNALIAEYKDAFDS